MWLLRPRLESSRMHRSDRRVADLVLVACDVYVAMARGYYALFML